MTEADCPDHLCMKQKAVDSTGGTIVCLPNKVVIEGEKRESHNEDSPEFDTAVCHHSGRILPERNLP